jgi:hypothetical protein
MDESAIKPLSSGSRGDYDWLTSNYYSLEEFLRSCPQVVLGKYLVVTSSDSTPLALSEDERASGWQSRNGLAYSPKISSIEKLPYDAHCHYDEWYVFSSPTDLGKLVADERNIFIQRPSKGEVAAFVNFNLQLHRPEAELPVEMFWQQLDWIRPVTYLADCQDCLTVVSADKALMEVARLTLSDLDREP